MGIPVIPEKLTVDLSAGLCGVKFRYIENSRDDKSLMMSRLLLDGLTRLCYELNKLGVVRIIHQGIYNPRRVRGGISWSNHAYATAIDLHSFVFADGRTVRCTDWTPEHHSPIIDKIWELCRQNFTEAIFNNKLHRDHIHAGYKGAKYKSEKETWYKIWEVRDTAKGNRENYETDRAVAAMFLKNMWNAIDAKDGDPETRVLNRITEFIKKEWQL